MRDSLRIACTNYFYASANRTALRLRGDVHRAGRHPLKHRVHLECGAHTLPPRVDLAAHLGLDVVAHLARVEVVVRVQQAHRRELHPHLLAGGRRAALQGRRRRGRDLEPGGEVGVQLLDALEDGGVAPPRLEVGLALVGALDGEEDVVPALEGRKGKARR